MCVIAFAPKNVDIPKDEVMSDMFDYNSDGAGIAYTLNNRVYVEKGYMEYKEFANALAGIEKRLKKAGTSTKEVPMAFHFRIGTHGPNSRGLTHPFPVAQKTKFFEALDYKTDIMMMHNGVITSVTPVNDTSDTVQYIRDVVHPLYIQDKKFFTNDNYTRLLANTINGSRLLFLDRDGDFSIIGDWKTDKNSPGVFFSNLNHNYTYSMPYRFKYGTSCSYDSKVGEKISVKKLPDGFFRGVGGKKSLAANEVARVESNLLIDYYVDYLGYVYHDITGNGSDKITPAIYYDTAYMDTGDKYMMITSASKELDNVETVEREVIEDDYFSYY